MARTLSRPPPPRRVALLIEATRTYARGLVRGVGRYARERRGWSVDFTPHAPGDPPPGWLAGWPGHGILARIEDRRTARAVLRTGLPAIDLRRAVPGLPLPAIGPDDGAVARLAFEHLRDRGFRRFGVYGGPPAEHPSMDARTEEFARLAREGGFACGILRGRAGRPSGAPWDEEVARAARWVRSLETPAGVMACNDDRGLLLLEACRRAGAAVPDDVAVVGAGNDDCLCDLAVPPLTSVDLDPERIGYEAARLLDGMMSGGSRRPRPFQVPPAGVATRASTDVLATEDPAVAQAVRFIRGRAGERLRVADVLQHVHMSRGALDPRMLRVLGRTAAGEIRRVRIERAKELLRTAGGPLKRIASQAGFRYPEYMARAFRQATGLTPTAFRRKARRI